MSYPPAAASRRVPTQDTGTGEVPSRRVAEETGVGRLGGRPRRARRLYYTAVHSGRLNLGGRRPAEGLRRPNRGRKRGPGGPYPWFRLIANATLRQA